MEHEKAFVLPTSVVGPVDVGRLLREAELIHDFLEQAAVRTGGEPVKMPKTSRLMDDVLQANQFNALVPADRAKIIQTLKLLKERAPVLHMSFSADPSPMFLQKIILWLRQNISPVVLVRVGLQPNLGAGCVVRTTNKYFDFSLRQRFAAKRQYFIDKLNTAITEPEGQQP